MDTNISEKQNSSPGEEILTSANRNTSLPHVGSVKGDFYLGGKDFILDFEGIRLWGVYLTKRRVIFSFFVSFVLFISSVIFLLLK